MYPKIETLFSNGYLRENVDRDLYRRYPAGHIDERLYSMQFLFQPIMAPLRRLKYFHQINC